MKESNAVIITSVTKITLLGTNLVQERRVRSEAMAEKMNST